MSISIIPGRPSSATGPGTGHVIRFAANLVRTVAQWPSRIRANRELLDIVGGMSDYELSDIGLSRQDIRDSAALPLTSEPGAFFAMRAAGRRRRI